MGIIFRSVHFEWPNGQTLFKNLNLSLEAQGKYGLIGPNGIGKTTLAQLIAGQHAVVSGEILKTVQSTYFSQFETPPQEAVGQYLAMLWANAGAMHTKVIQALSANIDFDQSCSSLSGGEWTRVRLLRQLLAGSEFIVLDEPTNNLDHKARQSILEFVQKTRCGLLIISHDRELLEQVHCILELSNRGLAVFGGNWSFYESQRKLERQRLEYQLQRAQKEKSKAKQAKIKKIANQEKRMQHAQKNVFKLGMPKVLTGARKRQAQQTLGKVHLVAGESVNQQLAAAREAFENLKMDHVIYADFPDTVIPATKLVLEVRDLNFQYTGSPQKLWKKDLSLSLKGPGRLWIAGENGSGKSTFLNLLTGFCRPSGTVYGHAHLGEVPYAFFDQTGALLNPTKTVFENVAECTQKSSIEIRNLLAQFLFPGEQANQLAKTLSGGERLRAALAKMLMAHPAPQLLILDEPTNNLDLVNLEFLENALLKYPGALIMISHDKTFIENIKMTQSLYF